MDLNDFYSSVSSFWGRISPLIYAHVIFFLGVRYVAGIRPRLRDRLEQWTQTPKYQAAKKLLTEFELWTKLPLLLIAAGLIYLTLLEDALSILERMRIPPLRMTYSEEQFWIESKPVHLLDDIIEYMPPTQRRYWQVARFKDQLVDEYKVKAAQRYERSVAWNDRNHAKFMQALRIGIGFFIAVIVLSVWYWRAERAAGVRRPFSILRLLTLLVLVVAFCVYERVRAEQAVEGRLYAELILVGQQLQFDKDRAGMKLPPETLWVARRDLVADLLSVDEAQRVDLPWLSRTIERIDWNGKPLLSRKFAHVSKKKFREDYGYVFSPPPPALGHGGLTSR